MNYKRKFVKQKNDQYTTDKICLFFGCGKKLSSFEALASDWCFRHAQEVNQAKLKLKKMNYES